MTFVNRRKVFKTQFDKNLVKKIYTRIKKGAEITSQDLMGNKSSSLMDIFIKIPQIDAIQKQVENLIETAMMINESQIKVIFGDYGQGKSQTAHLTMEYLKSQSNYSERIFILERITYFRKFIHTAAMEIHSQLDKVDRPMLLKLDRYLKPLMDEFGYVRIASLAEVLGNFMDVLKELSHFNYTTILVFDELDNITHDMEDMKQWIDFLVAISDQRDLKVVIIGFIPQSSASTIRSHDRRMHRWDPNFGIEALYLVGKYESKLEEAMANILALANQDFTGDIDDRDLEFFYHAMEHRYQYLMNSNIRESNLWAINVAQIIDRCNQYNLSKKVSQLGKLDRTNIGQLYERKIRIFNLKDNLPEFGIKHEELDIKIDYRFVYLRENLQVGKHESDGHYVMLERTASSEMEFTKIAVEIKYTQEETHVASQLEKVKLLSTMYPTILISLGPSAAVGQKLQEEMNEFTEPEITYYPIQVLNIPHSILHPLLIIPDDLSSLNEQYGIIRTYAEQVTDHRNLLVHFMRELISSLKEREIRLNSYHLAGIKPSNKKTKKTTTTSTTQTSLLEVVDEEEEKRKGWEFSFAQLLIIIDDIGTRKQKSTLEKELKKGIKKEFPQVVNPVMEKLSEIYTHLTERGFIEEDTWGNKPIIKKADGWDRTKAMAILKQTYM